MDFVPQSHLTRHFGAQAQGRFESHGLQWAAHYLFEMRITIIVAALLLLLSARSSCTPRKEKLVTQTMPQKKKSCNRESGGSCTKNKACPAEGCKLCVRHCTDHASNEYEQPKTPNPTRETKEKAKLKIGETLVARTPAAIRSYDANSRSWRDFYELVPRRPALLASLHDRFQLKVDMSCSVWNNFTSYAVDVVHKLADVVSIAGQQCGVREKLEANIAARFSKTERTHNRIEHSKSSLVFDLLDYLRKHPKTDRTCKALRAFFIKHFAPAELETLQEDKGVRSEDRVRYGADARARSLRDYKAFTGQEETGASGRGEELPDESPVYSRVSEEVIEEAVGFIVENCQLHSWGEKTMPIGNGKTMSIPRLTRKCGVIEMWNKYNSSKESEQIEFSHILGFEGPLRQENERYKGSAYNLFIEWMDGKSTWESLSAISHDDPVSCAVYGNEYDLLDETGWTRLKKYITEDGQPKEEATMKAFRGGRNAIGRTSFIELASALTAGDEKLVTSVDYVKGVLVHDVVDVLQRIIDDRISSPSVRKDMTENLTILSNFVKNHFKAHVMREDDWDTHGVEDGLRVPPSIAKSKHYSCCTKAELNSLIRKRKIKIKKKASIKERIRALERWDREQEAQAAGGGGTENTAELDGMSLQELREYVQENSLGVKARSREALLAKIKDRQNSQGREEASRSDSEDDAPALDSNRVVVEGVDDDSDDDIDDAKGDVVEFLRRNVDSMAIEPEKADDAGLGLESIDSNKSLESVDDSVTTPTQESKSDDIKEAWESENDGTTEPGQVGASTGCEGCTFLHQFLLQDLPNALRAERTDEKEGSIENALEYIKCAHEKLMLYQGHVARVANQNANLKKFDEKLQEQCQQEKNEMPLLLYLIIDFKMKWEPMYSKEKATENFGKRGISWHGNRVHFWVWDSKRGEPVKKVIKLDQILDGGNKQDGLTVLALLEATLTYLKQEFPNASVEYMQADNASAYHLKDLVLGIPLLNAVSVLWFAAVYLGLESSTHITRTYAADAQHLWACYQKLCSHRNAR